MAKSNGWIHGGKYVPADGAGRSANHPASTLRPRARANNNSSSESHEIPLEILWTKIINAMGYILPILATIIKTILTFMALCVGGIVYGIETLRSRATAGESIHSQNHVPIRQSNNIPLGPRVSPPTGVQTTAIHEVSPANDETSTDNPIISQNQPHSLPSGNSSVKRSNNTPATKSLLRKRSSSSNSTGNKRDSFGSKPPRSARRVLFTETSEGEVHRTEVLYDKELPASARKVRVETKESLEARVAASRRRESYSPSSLVRGGELRGDGSPLNNTGRLQQQQQQRTPLADVNSISSSPSKNQILIPPKLHSPAPVVAGNKRPAAVLDANQKRRNLIAVSRYNNHRNNRMGYRPNTGYYGPMNGPKNKRQREEMEELVWKAMNKKGRVDGGEEEVVNRAVESKTPRKVR